MQVLNKTIELESFFQRVANAPARVLMLDYDGTLAPFRIDPAEAVPHAGVSDLIGDLARERGTRVVIVSGRAAQEIPRLLAPAGGIEIWGAHGWERLLPDGRLVVHEPEAATRDALIGAREAARRFISAGARIEEKRASIGLHTRGLPADTAARLHAETTAAWSAIAREAKLEILPFDGGVELRARGWTKAHAVDVVISETDAEGAVAYLGDDLTDEDAFRAVKPRGLAVLVRDELRKTEADLWLKPPEELLAFMRRWQAAKG